MLGGLRMLDHHPLGEHVDDECDMESGSRPAMVEASPPVPVRDCSGEITVQEVSGLNTILGGDCGLSALVSASSLHPEPEHRSVH